jgi:hypothetical protein
VTQNLIPLTDSQRIAPERLAALLDGRLGEPEAESFRRVLAAAHDLLSVYADAVAVTREMAIDDSAPPVPAAGRR